MDNIYLILLILFLVLILAYRHFNPTIDLVLTGGNSYKLILWYNKWEDTSIIRTYKVLWTKE